MVARRKVVVGRRQARRPVEVMETRVMLSGSPVLRGPVATTTAALTTTATVKATAAVQSGAVQAGAVQAAAKSAAKSVASPIAVVLGGPYKTLPLRAANGQTAPFYPADVRSFYGVNAVTFNGTFGNGAGQTVAIIDAYKSGTEAADLASFSSTFGLPAPSMTIVSQTGSTTALPAFNSGWAGEISLDIEWVHAMAPQAKIMMVECNSASNSDLYAGVQYAANNGATVVSMSFGGGESTSYDSVFTHANVTYLASTGDTGGAIEGPSTSVNVVAVGGTAIAPANSTGAYGSESAWTDGGGGVSAVEARPNYQIGINTGSTTRRTVPDISAIADPNTGVIVYQAGSYYQVGGTSLSAPVWAGLMAVANQGRALAGLSALTGSSQTLPRLYQMAATDFHDVTTGSNTHAATAGYDQATGLGTPVSGKLLPDLAGGAKVTGRLFSDNNANGTFDGTDTALTGQVVYLDQNNNGVRDTGVIGTEPTATVASDGTYTFSSLTAGGDLIGGLSGAVRLLNAAPAGYVAVGTGSTFTTAYNTTATANVALFPTAYADATPGDAYTVRMSPTSSTTEQILLNGTVAYSAPASLVASSGLSFALSGTGQTVSVDLANGNPVPTGGLSVNGGATANGNALAVLGSAGNDTVTVNGGTVSFATGGTINSTNLNNLVVDPRGGTDALTVNAATVAVPAQTAGGGFLARTFSTLAVGNGGQVNVGTAAARSDRTVVVIAAGGSLSVGSTGQLNLGGNDMVVRGGSVSAVATLAGSGFAGGAWTGFGLASSAAANSGRTTALGVIQNANPNTAAALYSTFDGQSASASDVLVKYTYYGDANLDGAVNAADFSLLDAGSVLGRTGWLNGDLNYDGVIDGADYALADNGFNFQTVTL